MTHPLARLFFERNPEACAAGGVDAKRVEKHPDTARLLQRVAITTAGETAAGFFAARCSQRAFAAQALRLSKAVRQRIGINPERVSTEGT